MKITFIRHGHSESNQKNILSSNISDDFYLTEIGENELSTTAKKFRPKNSERVYLYCSPMKRTIHSAEIYLKNSGLDIPINLDIRIKEIDYGKYSGQENVGYIQERIDDAYSKFKKNGDNLFRIGETGENNYEFLLRNYEFLLDIYKKHFFEKNCHIIVISHAGPIRAMENLILNNDEHRPRINNGEYHTHKISIKIHEHIKRKIQKLNHITRYAGDNNIYDVVIGGAGLFGIICAERLAAAGKKVLILEKNNYIGGMCASYNDSETGIEIHKFGPHIFHIKNKDIYEYISKFDTINSYRHKIKSAISTGNTNSFELYDMPLNLASINKFFNKKLSATEAKKFIFEKTKRDLGLLPTNAQVAGVNIFGKELFNNFFANYTQKQWGRPASLLPPNLFSRYQIKWDNNDDAFMDQYQGVPKSGFNIFFEKIIKYANDNYCGSIEVNYSTDFLEMSKVVREKSNHPLMVYTGAIDEYFGYKLGKLDYRSLRFVNKTLNVPHFQPVAVINYPQKRFKYTRICEHKYFHPERLDLIDSNNTVVTYEYPISYEQGLERFYPIEDEKNIKLFELYVKMSKVEYKKNRVLFGGRLGEYKYYDMENTITSALKLSEKIIKKYL